MSRGHCMVGGVGTITRELSMSAKRGHSGDMAVASMGTFVPVALFLMTLSTPAISQVWGDATEQELTTRAEDLDRFEAERLRQQRSELEKERRRQEKMRFETERLRQENERQEQERLRLENEKLRQEIERQEQTQLRLENEAMERKLAQTAALRELTQTNETRQSTDPDVYDQLRTLGQLRDEGILTEEEFQNLKKRILN
jgi:Short C-terminal domain